MFRLNDLPDDIILKINSELNSIKLKFHLKLLNSEFNNLLQIPFNFKNKFIKFCENNSYNYDQIDFRLLESLDENNGDNSDNSDDSVYIWYGHALIPKWTVKCSVNNVKFDLMFPFSHMFKNTFKMYNKECPEKWFWYHSAVSYKNNNDEDWKTLTE